MSDYKVGIGWCKNSDIKEEKVWYKQWNELIVTNVNTIWTAILILNETEYSIVAETIK